MSLESLKPFRIPKENTRPCHEGQRKVFLPIESPQQHDSSKTTHDVHVPTMHSHIIKLPFVWWLIFICTLVIYVPFFTLTIASDTGRKSTEADAECPHSGLP